MESEADTALDFTRRFARALAHDANNLTGAILVLSELMQMADGQNATRISDLATKIRKACWQLQIRINQPLALDHLPWAVRSHVHVSRLQELAHDLVSSLMPKKSLSGSKRQRLILRYRVPNFCSPLSCSICCAMLLKRLARQVVR